jgi:hypothetical protein
MEIANDITAPTTRPDPSGRRRRLSLGSQEMGRATPRKIISPYGYACSFADTLCEIGQIFPGREFWFHSKRPKETAPTDQFGCAHFVEWQEIKPSKE